MSANKYSRDASRVRDAHHLTAGWWSAVNHSRGGATARGVIVPGPTFHGVAWRNVAWRCASAWQLGVATELHSTLPDSVSYDIVVFSVHAAPPPTPPS